MSAAKVTRRLIVKVQRSLASSDGNSAALIYNRTMSVYHFAPMTEDVRALLGPKLKVYVWADIVDGGKTLRLDRPAPVQDW